MAIEKNGVILRHLHTLFNVGAIGALTDGQLLERFAAGSGEARELAFAALVERHGPFVLRICRAVLGNEHEADDAFQATFLALVRKAESLLRDTRWGPGCTRRPIAPRAMIDPPGHAVDRTSAPRRCDPNGRIRTTGRKASRR